MRRVLSHQKKGLTMSKRGTCSAVPASEVGGVIADLYERVGGRNGQQWLDRVKESLRTKLSDPLSHKEEPVPDWETWQKVAVGGKSRVRNLLWDMSYRYMVGKAARMMVLSKTFSAFMYGDVALTEIDLVKVTLADLGIVVDPMYSHIGAPLAAIVSAAREKNLFLCPADVIFQLHPRCLPRGKKFLVMTRPFPLNSYYGLFHFSHPHGSRSLPNLDAKRITCPYSDNVAGEYDPDLVFWHPSADAPRESRSGYDY